MSAAWVGVQIFLCHDKWGDANGELKHIWLTQPCYCQMPCALIEIVMPYRFYNYYRLLTNGAFLQGAFSTSTIITSVRGRCSIDS